VGPSLLEKAVTPTGSQTPIAQPGSPVTVPTELSLL
jgi:hypothetical protein